MVAKQSPPKVSRRSKNPVIKIFSVLLTLSLACIRFWKNASASLNKTIGARHPVQLPTPSLAPTPAPTTAQAPEPRTAPPPAPTPTLCPCPRQAWISSKRRVRFFSVSPKYLSQRRSTLTIMISRRCRRDTFRSPRGRKSPFARRSLGSTHEFERQAGTRSIQGESQRYVFV